MPQHNSKGVVMKILLLGGTGRTGRLAAGALRDAGHELRALHRREVPGVQTIVAKIDDPEAMEQALSGVDAVVSALASSNTDPVCSKAASAVVVAAGGRPYRYISVAGAGVDVPGDSKALPDRIVGGIMKLVVGRMLADRQREHQILADSNLDWTLLRPPRLIDGPPTGRVVWSFDTPAATKIRRSDLAQAMADALGRDDLIGRAPFVAEGKP
jgi:uncharacterized protein YbjT (DUF2867 family)